MAFKKKTWKDRLVEFAGRRQITRVAGDPNGTMIADIARYEGTVSQGGDPFSGANMNDLEQRIADEFALVNSNLSELISFQQTNTTAAIKQGYQTVTLKTPSNTAYTWRRIETAASGFVTVMSGSDDSIAIGSDIANTINITFVSTFIGIKKL